MKNLVLFSALSLTLCGALASSACSSSSGGTGATTTTTTATGGSTTSSSSTSSSSSSSTTSGTTTTSSTTTGNPAPPTLGTQLDRIGRPAINTALNHGFDASSAAGTAKDAYNADSTPSDWKTNYQTQFEGNLAIIDALDGTCGNQLGYASPASATSYGLLAGALTDDQLYVNTAGTTHTTYLAVEVNALGVLVNTDQGGRTLPEVVMDTTYSALAIGAFTGVSNGITTNNVSFLTAFPFEAPHN